MAEKKLDYKKQYRDLYLPGETPMLIDVPPMHFAMVDGSGEPAGQSYQEALQILYALTFTIKMSKINGRQPEGYFEYVVPPLEGLWWCRGGKLNFAQPKEEWLWTSMIRQPEFVTAAVFAAAGEECRKKKNLDTARVRLESFREGLCVQAMHIGPYGEEGRSIEKIAQYIEENRLIDLTGDVNKHHEIYLSDPRKTSPDKLRTVLRFPVKRRGNNELG